MTRAIKIEWKNRKEQGRCKFADIKPGKHFWHGNQLYQRMFKEDGARAVSKHGVDFPPNAMEFETGQMVELRPASSVQPVTIRKVVLRK